MPLQNTFCTLVLGLSTALALGACGDSGGSNDDGPNTSPTSGGSNATEPVDTTTGDSSPTEASNTSPESTGNASVGSTGNGTTEGLESSGSEEGSSSGGATTGDEFDCAGGMSFATLTSEGNQLTTSLSGEDAIMCSNVPVTIVATGGTVCALDDGNEGYYYTIQTLELEDVEGLQCGIATLSLTNLRIENIGNGMEVVVPQIGGNTSGQQSITIVADVEGNVAGVFPIPTTPLSGFDGQLPEGTVAFGENDTTVTYMDTTTTLATAMPDVMGTTATVTLTGLTGELTFAP